MSQILDDLLLLLLRVSSLYNICVYNYRDKCSQITNLILNVKIVIRNKDCFTPFLPDIFTNASD